MKKLNVISLFSGAGGMDLGFIKAGFEIIWANDFEKDAVETYKFNIGTHILLDDIRNIDSNEIPGDDVDVVIGGFPCQGFSIANTGRNMKDERNFLYQELLRIIKDKNPKFFVAENVKGLLSMEKGRVIDMIMNDFSSIGYNVDYRILNASDYGVPQNRERVIIIGNRFGLKNPFPKPTHGEGLKEKVTTKEAIGFLSKIDIVNGMIKETINVDGRLIHNHIASTNVADKFFGRKYDVNQEDICDYLKYWRSKSNWSVSEIDKHFGYKYTAGHWFRNDNNSGSIPKPEDWWELKKILKFDDRYDKEVTTFIEKPIKYEQSLRITNWDTPSDTITATSPEIHVNKKRRLSARECAILQTFPDEFVFKGSLNSIYRQIGNAVPVTLATKIAGEIKKSILKLDEVEYHQLSFSI
ncbi:DNA cytosine methyltransferase [uncultured Anaerococcus sp.]|uniref:DNA cytosine methyltransferase n=1 Tax=uncultured Anaerococcus sp. TaxID=293428 RepID=UPI00288ACE7E|nr:DNA cytosine methyltransferase [uncultured Anaerococcus sp.]